MSGIGRRLTAKLRFLSIAIVALTMPAGANADEFCAVLKKIVAARDGSFKSISKKDGTAMVKLPGASSCERDEDDYFDCNFESGVDKDKAEMTHQALDAKISACYPKAKRTEETKKNGAKDIDFQLSEHGTKISVNLGRAIETYYVHVWVDNDDIF